MELRLHTTYGGAGTADYYIDNAATTTIAIYRSQIKIASWNEGANDNDLPTLRINISMDDGRSTE